MPKKKLLVVTELYPYPGNIYLGTFVTSQLQILKNYYDITVLTVYPSILRLFHKQPAYSRYESGLRIISIPYYPLLLYAFRMLGILAPQCAYLNKIIAHRRLLKTAKALHNATPFNLIHGHEVYIGDEAGPIGCALNIPSVFTLHSFHFYHTKIFGKLVVAKAVENLRLCIESISVSSIAAESYIVHGLSRKSFTIIPNGVNPSQTHTKNQRILNFAQGRKVLLSVGYLSADKRFDMSIQALSKLSPHDAVLVIVGIGADKRKLKKLTQTLNCDDRVLFLGAVPPPSMPEVYQSADILLHPSIIDSFSMVCLEAMSNKKVVICTSTIGICEFTEDGKNILVVPPGKIEPLLNTIKKILNNPEEYNRISANALVFAETLNWENQVQLIQHVYKHAMDTWIQT